MGFESEVRRKDGSTIWISEAARAVPDAHGRILYYEGAVEDITARKEADRIQERAREAALESARVKAQFLANMSHEIRTPMNAIVGMTDLLARTRLGQEQREYVETIRNSTDSLLTVINDILDYSKIEAGKLSIECIELDLRETVESTVELLAVRAHQKNIELACWLQPDVPTLLRGDPSRLRQVLINLVSNAIKFTADGEVVVTVARVEEDADTARLRFAIKDTGIGIAPEVMPRIFQEFTQADGSTTRKYGGTGLGLTISKQLVELMGGRISVQSMPGQGSEFSFEIPFAKQDKTQPASSAAEETSLTGLRVLVVDDHETQREFLRRELELWHMQVTQAAASEQALQLLRAASAADQPFDLVLFDQDLSDMDGLSFAQKLKAESTLAACRLVMLTALGGNRPTPAALEASGIAACVVKPPRQARLLECLINAMSSAPAADAAGGSLATLGALASREAVRILLAEDNVVNQRVALTQLKKLGFRADAVSNGIEVLAALQRERFDIVLMDCQMPELDGYEAARRIRRGDAGPHYQGGTSPYIID